MIRAVGKSCLSRGEEGYICLRGHTQTDDECILGIENRDAFFVNVLAGLKDSH